MENLNIQLFLQEADNKSYITWTYENCDCEMIVNRLLTYGEAVNLIECQTRDEHESCIIDIDYIGRTLKDEGSDPEYYSEMLN